MPQEIFIGRQPIYDRNLDLFAYELLYRSSTDNQAAFEDGDIATSEVIVNTFMDMGLESIVGNSLAFINLTRGFVTGQWPLPLGRDRVVLEVLEEVLAEPEVIAAVNNLAAEGHTIALDDFSFDPAMDPLLHLAHIVKVDIRATPRETLAERVIRLRHFGVQLLAEKVETQEELAYCQELGFDYFQGYFFCRPNVIQGRRIATNRLVILNLLAKLQDPDAELGDLEALIVQDVSLTYRLLRYINSAGTGLSRKVESIHRALLLLGTRLIRHWVTLLVLARIEDKPKELITTSLVRAKMCELIGQVRGADNLEQHFTVGLFSTLDAMMDQPLEALVPALPLTDEVSAALLQHRGPLGETLDQVLDYERGLWHRLAGAGLAPQAMREAYLSAVRWADATCDSLTAA